MYAVAESEEEIASIRKFQQLVAAQLKGGEIGAGDIKVLLHGTEVTLPKPLMLILSRAAELMGAGRGVDVVSPAQELSVQQAADHLNVSRPYVMNLIRKGIIPHRLVGTHHRIPLDDLLAYKRDQAPKRQAALNDLVRQTEELGS